MDFCGTWAERSRRGRCSGLDWRPSWRVSVSERLAWAFLCQYSSWDAAEGTGMLCHFSLSFSPSLPHPFLSFYFSFSHCLPLLSSSNISALSRTSLKPHSTIQYSTDVLHLFLLMHRNSPSSPANHLLLWSTFVYPENIVYSLHTVAADIFH